MYFYLQDHIAEAYSDETTDFSEESLEMARMPLFPPLGTQPPLNSEQLAEMYGDMSLWSRKSHDALATTSGKKIDCFWASFSICIRCTCLTFFRYPRLIMNK